MIEQRLRPMTLGDVFDEAFDLYKSNLLLLVLTTAVAAVPLTIIVSVVALHFLHSVLGLTSGGDSPDPTQVFSWLGSLVSGAAIFVPLYSVLYAIQVAALAGAASARYLGEPITVWQSYRLPFRRLLPLAFAGLLYGVAIVIGYGFCGIGAALPATLFLFTAHAFVLEGTGVFRSFGRSKALAAGYGGMVFGCLLLLCLLYFILSLGIQMPLDYFLETVLKITPGIHALTAVGTASSLSPSRQVIDQVASGIADIVVIPFIVCVITVLYYDLRIRKEAFDVELMARGLRYPPLSAFGPSLPPAAPAYLGPPLRTRAAVSSPPPPPPPSGLGGIQR